jgi:hypothetical protein
MLAPLQLTLADSHLQCQMPANLRAARLVAWFSDCNLRVFKPPYNTSCKVETAAYQPLGLPRP